MEYFPHLHDATLISLAFSWGDRELRCVVRPVSAEDLTVTVLFSGVQGVTIPAERSWGNSSSVNSWSREKHELGFIFTIEMQSGDVIKVVAKDIILPRPTL
jgi:hypothetical protein